MITCTEDFRRLDDHGTLAREVSFPELGSGASTKRAIDGGYGNSQRGENLAKAKKEAVASESDFYPMPKNRSPENNGLVEYVG